MAVRSSRSAVLTPACSCSQSSPPVPLTVSIPAPHHLACTQGLAVFPPTPSCLVSHCWCAALPSHPHTRPGARPSHNSQYPIRGPRQGTNALKTLFITMLGWVIPLCLAFCLLLCFSLVCFVFSHPQISSAVLVLPFPKQLRKHGGLCWPSLPSSSHKHCWFVLAQPFLPVRRLLWTPAILRCHPFSHFSEALMCGHG